MFRRIYDEFAEGRFGTCTHLFDPDIEYTRSSGPTDMPSEMANHRRGIEGMTEAAMEWIAIFERLRIRAERFIEVGDSVLVFVRHTGNAKASGVPIDEEFADVLTLRDGRVTRFDQYRDRDEALEAVGLRE